MSQQTLFDNGTVSVQKDLETHTGEISIQVLPKWRLIFVVRLASETDDPHKKVEELCEVQSRYSDETDPTHRFSKEQYLQLLGMDVANAPLGGADPDRLRQNTRMAIRLLQEAQGWPDGLQDLPAQLIEQIGIGPTNQ